MWTLAKTVFHKRWLDYKRYSVNLISSVIVLYIIFLVLFLGYKTVGGKGPNFGRSLDAIIVGYLIWVYAMGAYSSLAFGIVEESTRGTLEQLYMTPFGFRTYSIFLIISDFILNLTFVIPILFLMMLTTGHWLHIDLATLVPLFILTIGGVYGIGFILGGLALIHKKLQAFIQIVQFLMIGLVALPANKGIIYKLPPLSLGNYLIRKSMVDKVSIFHLPACDLLILLLTSIFYLALGMFIFSKCERVAREKGLLAHY